MTMVELMENKVEMPVFAEVGKPAENLDGTHRIDQNAGNLCVPMLHMELGEKKK